ncbi:hypothetical protein KPH14_012053 [Odynerus spinipes]|uniref:Death domain-containing protein n=1 Tax=Odynerus spinipes TaxID=1348599 RepID=A0AAD9R9F4_9HYME|nr:hypothetical protein KPH14_012053 [Odynerus spinipes]
MASSTITLNTEIRKLKPVHRYALGEILNLTDSWKKLMAIIPQNDTNVTRFNSEHVSIIEQVARKYRQNAAEILLDEWGTMGRERPTLQILLDLLIKAELFRAADYVASEILNVDLPQRPEYGPAAIIDISDETLAKLINKQAKLENNEYDESTSIYGSSCEINVGEIRYLPDAIDLMDPCLRKNNLYVDESDKAILKSTEKDLIKFSTNKIPKMDSIQNDTKSDEMILKVIEKEDINSQNSQIAKGPSTDCKLQEISSKELPAFLNNFEQSKIMNNNELKSEELPAFLNQSSFLLHKSVMDSGNNCTRTADINNSSNSSDYESSFRNIENNKNSTNYQLQTEVSSSLLPQYAVDRKEIDSVLYKTNNNNENITNSKELPLMVLEYNR